MIMRIATALLTLAFALATPAFAEEKPVELKKAPGLDKVEANCAACHSLDYIPMNSPFPNAALWDAEVTKMIKAFGAPIDEADAKAIADYLKKNYGSGLTYVFRSSPRKRGPRATKKELDTRFRGYERSQLAAQLRVAHGVDPIGAFRRRGEKDILLAAEAALQFGAREERRKLRVGAGGEQRQAVERAGEHAAVAHFGAAVAEPAADLEARLLEGTRKAQAAARAVRRIVGEGLDQDRAEFRLDGARRDRVRQAQLRNARRDVVRLAHISLLACAMKLDHRACAAGLAERQDVLARAPIRLPPDRVAQRLEVGDRHREGREWLVDLDPVRRCRLRHAGPAPGDLGQPQAEDAERRAIDEQPRQGRVKLEREHADQRKRDAGAGRNPGLRGRQRAAQHRTHAVPPNAAQRVSPSVLPLCRRFRGAAGRAVFRRKGQR